MRISDWSSDVCSSDLHSARLPCPNMAIDALPQIFRDFDRGRRRHSEAPCRQLIDTCPFDIDRAAAVESCAHHFFRKLEIHASGYTTARSLIEKGAGQSLNARQGSEQKRCM